MTAKEYLQQYKQLDEQILSRCEELERLKSLAVKITPTYSDMPKPKISSSSGSLPAMVEKIIMLEAELGSLIDNYVELRKEIEQVISSVDDIKLRSLLKYKYIDGCTLDEIADKMHYSYKQICRLHGQALLKVMSSNVP